MRARSTPPIGALESEIATRLRADGASLVGFADLSGFPDEATHGFSSAVSIAKALDPSVVAELERGPTPAYHEEYDRVNLELGRLAEIAAGLLGERGHGALLGAATVKAVLPGKDTTPLPHKTVATRAGLGWIGHSALLVTRENGPAVRLVSVLTDAPLTGAGAVERSSCGTCRRCVEACPAAAISGRPWVPGLPRDQLLDAEACRERATALAATRGIDATICGICIFACPWTQRHLERSRAVTK